MSEATRAGGPAATDPSMAEDLTVVREQTREILELVRSLVAMLLPRDDGEGPKLEDLIAALIAQQRDILVAIRQVQSDVQGLVSQTKGANAETADPDHVNGSMPA